METQKENDMLLLERHTKQLMEHFETIQIFATRHKPGDAEGSTMTADYGNGNWFARYGQIALWIDNQNLYGEIEPPGELT